LNIISVTWISFMYVGFQKLKVCSWTKSTFSFKNCGLLLLKLVTIVTQFGTGVTLLDSNISSKLQTLIKFKTATLYLLIVAFPLY